MQIQPTIRAVRFAKLEPGDLMIFPFQEGPGFALKVVDLSHDNDTFILPLGPVFSPEDRQPRLLADHATTTVSVGKDFIFRFSEKPADWSVTEPSLEYYCAALVDDQVYLRANGHLYPGSYVHCWVRLDGGVLQWNFPPGITAYATGWEILLPQQHLPPRSILMQSHKPIIGQS